MPVAENDQVLVGAPFFISLIRVESLSSGLGGADMADLGNKQIVPVHQLVTAAGERADVSGASEQRAEGFPRGR